MLDHCGVCACAHNKAVSGFILNGVLVFFLNLTWWQRKTLFTRIFRLSNQCIFFMYWLYHAYILLWTIVMTKTGGCWWIYVACWWKRYKWQWRRSEKYLTPEPYFGFIVLILSEFCTGLTSRVCMEHVWRPFWIFWRMCISQWDCYVYWLTVWILYMHV